MRTESLRTTVADYLALESRSHIRHEYVDGELHAMSGASRRHNLLVTCNSDKSTKALSCRSSQFPTDKRPTATLRESQHSMTHCVPYSQPGAGSSCH
ncbi:MAG: hypothetical protein HC872_05545 [Gammaproteobacteria bacterium]|nr:hypothetical protein [Gammaproteobacteria bacterium]